MEVVIIYLLKQLVSKYLVSKQPHTIYNWKRPALIINHDYFREKSLAYVDENWFNLFDYDFVNGDTAG